jgi:hypothetical protein
MISLTHCTLHSHFWWDVLPRCYDPCWLNNMFYVFWFMNLLWTHEDSQFSLQKVLRILNTCVLDFCVVSVVCSVWVDGPFYGC